MECIIIAGGFGTRIRELFSDIPKILLPINGDPFLKFLLKLLKKQRVEKLLFALGYKAEKVLEFLNKNPPFCPFEFSIEKEPLGTGGALLNMLQCVKKETFLALNGDSFLNFSLSKLSKFHEKNNSDLTIASVEVKDGNRYGNLKIDSHGRITEFSEKSQRGGIINGGVYLFNRKLLKSFKITPCSLEKDIFPNLLSNRVFSYKCNDIFIDIGTKASYFKAQEIL